MTTNCKPTSATSTPLATYARGGAGARIGFDVAACELGFILVAATAKGVCAVSLGEAPAALEAALRAEFPGADVERDEAQLSDFVREITASLAGHAPQLELPLDVRATAFQWRVWQQLRAIPSGQTRSYAQIAQALQQPNASRAVARACATNPLALVVPCHRVVRGDGALAGYRWGVARKRALLKSEAERI